MAESDEAGPDGADCSGAVKFGAGWEGDDEDWIGRRG